MATISGKTITLKKGNKENTRPTTSGSTKSLIKIGIPKTVPAASVPLHSKNNKKETIIGKGEDTQKTCKTVQKGATSNNAKKRNTLSQAFLAKHAIKQGRLVTEAPKQPATMPPKQPATMPPKPPATMPPKPVPGTYKGRVVQSKIGAIWKSSSTSLEGAVDNSGATKASVPRVESQKNGHFTQIRSKSVADLPRRGTQKPLQRQPPRAKSVADGPIPVSKGPIPSSKCPAASRAIPSRCVGATARTASSGSLARPGSSKTAMISSIKESQSSKPKMPVTTDKKVHKPPVSSTISQYRTSMETAEERRAKLAEWLLSKGKTLKRPPISSAAPPKTRLVKEADVHPTSQSVTEPKSSVEPQPPAQSDTESQPGLKAPEPLPPSQSENNQAPEEKTACWSTPQIMNTTLDLLENSDMDLPDVKMDDIIVNLCDALEAMETSSPVSAHEPHEGGEFDEKLVDGKSNNEERNESGSVEEKIEAGDWTLKKDNMSCVEEVESDGDGDELMQTTPENEGASVVKYSVKTTPYLQSVKRTIEGEASASGSRRKSTIKDLKFLTPVRRSCRIQRNSSCLPGMLTDHDPCVSSLAELVQLDDDANAYIYRKNPALLDDLPDHPKDLERI